MKQNVNTSLTHFAFRKKMLKTAVKRNTYEVFHLVLHKYELLAITITIKQ